MSSNAMLNKGSPETARLSDWDAGDVNNRQIGGNHYALSRYQHWDYASDLYMRHLEGAGTKYLSRAGNKAGEPRLQDLEKAMHYFEKLLVTYQESRISSLHDVQGSTFDAEGPTAKFIAASMRSHAFTPRSIAIMVRLSRWANADDLKQCLMWLKEEIDEEKRKPVAIEAAGAGNAQLG